MKYYWAIFLAIMAMSLSFSYVHVENPVVLGRHTLSVCIYIVAGGFFAYLAHCYQNLVLLFRKLPKTAILLVYLGGFLLISYRHLVWSSKIAYPLWTIISCFYLGFVLLEQNFSVHSLFKLSKSKWLTSAGKFNYGLYLFHMVALFIIHGTFRFFHLPLHQDLITTCGVAIAALGLTLFMSYLSYEYFEKRFIALKEKYYGSNGFGLVKQGTERPLADNSTMNRLQSLQ